MEIEKVIRIFAITLVVAVFAVKVSTRLLFPDSTASGSGPLSIMLILCLISIWRDTDRKCNEKSNE